MIQMAEALSFSLCVFFLQLLHVITVVLPSFVEFCLFSEKINCVVVKSTNIHINKKAVGDDPLYFYEDFHPTWP